MVSLNSVGTSVKIKAFILCAGLGTRLRPITQVLPKPLIPLLGKPLLSYILQNLSFLPITEFGFNLHHLPHKIERFLREHPDFPRFKIFWEKEILGTGGALKNAYAFLEDSTFLVHNGDIFTEANLFPALKFHLKHKPIATLLVIDYPIENKLIIDEEGRLLNIEKSPHRVSPQRKVAFTGIAFYDRRFLRYLKEGNFSVIEAWLSALYSGETILTYPLEGTWFDLGTPLNYLKAVIHLLRKEGENFYIHPEATISTLNLHEFVSIESKTYVKRESFLKNVVLLAEEREVRGRFENALILGEKVFSFSREELFSDSSQSYAIGYGGSERKFYRLASNMVKMKALRESEELKRTVEYNLFLAKSGIPVPKILRVELEKGEVFFRDLGDLSLYNYLKIIRDKEARERIYRRVIDVMVKLHTIRLDGKAPTFPLFDYEHFRWESKYFQEKFLDLFCSLKGESALDSELEALAREAALFPKNLIHRDFQSQNVILFRNKVYLIDYQGARLGPPGYDFVALVFDPYVEISPPLREALLRYYIYKRKEIDPDFEEELFLRSLPVLRIQRHLQALGAYANLALVRGKAHFLKYIPCAFRYLKEEVNSISLPTLKAYLERVEGILRRRGFF